MMGLQCKATVKHEWLGKPLYERCSRRAIAHGYCNLHHPNNRPGLRRKKAPHPTSGKKEIEL